MIFNGNRFTQNMSQKCFVDIRASANLSFQPPPRPQTLDHQALEDHQPRADQQQTGPDRIGITYIFTSVTSAIVNPDGIPASNHTESDSRCHKDIVFTYPRRLRSSSIPSGPVKRPMPAFSHHWRNRD